MVKKLYGTDPDQVPTNADLGTMAYQDKDNFNLGGANNSESKLVMGKFTDRDVLYQYGTEIPTLIVQNDDYASNDGVGIIMDSNQRAGFYTENGDAHLRTWIKHPVNATYGHFIYQVAVGLDDPENNGTEVFRIKGSGDILPQGNVVMTNGAGIDFSATGNSSGTTTSELLDDYEEGTAAISYSDGTNSSSTKTVKYTKIGDLVTITIDLYNLNISSTTGALRVDGLPYTVNSSAGGRTVLVGSITDNHPVLCQAINATSYANLYVGTSGGANLDTLKKGDFVSETQAALHGQLMYRTNS